MANVPEPVFDEETLRLAEELIVIGEEELILSLKLSPDGRPASEDLNWYTGSPNGVPRGRGTEETYRAQAQRILKLCCRHNEWNQLMADDFCARFRNEEVQKVFLEDLESFRSLFVDEGPRNAVMIAKGWIAEWQIEVNRLIHGRGIHNDYWGTGEPFERNVQRLLNCLQHDRTCRELQEEMRNNTTERVRFRVILDSALRRELISSLSASIQMNEPVLFIEHPGPRF